MRPAKALEQMHKDYVLISGSRCAMTSYNRNKGRSIETELDLANRLMIDHHWSPFEHQAQMISLKEDKCHVADTTSDFFSETFHQMEKGIQVKFELIGDYIEKSYWSRNFQGMVQARALLDS